MKYRNNNNKMNKFQKIRYKMNKQINKKNKLKMKNYNKMNR